MDLHNNQVGRDIGSHSGTEGASRDQCRDAARNGTLRTLK